MRRSLKICLLVQNMVFVRSVNTIVGLDHRLRCLISDGITLFSRTQICSHTHKKAKEKTARTNYE